MMKLYQELAIVLLCVSMVTGDCSCDDTVCLYESMKTALYTTSVADALQLAFFTTIPFFDNVRISTAVNLTITDDSLNTSTSYNVSWLHQWYPYTSYGVLRKLFPAVFRGSMDPWTALPVFYQFYNNEYFTPVSLSINLTCVTNTSGTVNALLNTNGVTLTYPIPDPTPTTKTKIAPTHTSASKSPASNVKNSAFGAIVGKLNQLWAKSLQWAKAYGRYNGPAPYPSDEDRGIAYDVTAFTSTDLLAFSLFCVLYILFNLAVAIIIISASPLVVKWLSNASQKKPYIFSLYTSVAGLSAMYCVVYLVGKIIIFTKRAAVLGQIREDAFSKLFRVFEIISFVVPWTLVCLHFGTSLYASKEAVQLTFSPQEGQGEDKYTNIVKYIRRHRRAAFAASMWCVMLGIQLLAASFIPAVVSLLTDSFRSLALFSIAITAMLCLVVVMAIVIHICRIKASNSKSLISSIIVLAVFGLLITVAFSIYFLVLTSEGLDGNSISTYVLSLVPSLLLAGVAYFSDNYLLLDDKEASEEEEEEEEEEEKDGSKVTKKKHKEKGKSKSINGVEMDNIAN